MARHPEAPGGHCETIGTHRAFQQPCMRRRIYWNRKEKSMFQKTRSQGALGESEKKEADVDGLRNLPARPPCVLLVYGIVCMWLRCSLLGLLRWLVGLGDPGLANRSACGSRYAWRRIHKGEVKASPRSSVAVFVFPRCNTIYCFIQHGNGLLKIRLLAQA